MYVCACGRNFRRPGDLTRHKRFCSHTPSYRIVFETSPLPSPPKSFKEVHLFCNALMIIQDKSLFQDIAIILLGWAASQDVCACAYVCVFMCPLIHKIQKFNFFRLLSCTLYFRLSKCALNGIINQPLRVCTQNTSIKKYKIISKNLFLCAASSPLMKSKSSL